MGLDMYVNAKKYRYQFKDVPEGVDVLGVILGSGFHPSRISCVTEEAIYWRKANQIHKWFVDNVQDGSDDCGNYPITREHLQRLLALIKQVLADRNEDVASELLPTGEGFFFGSSDYDEYYWQQLEFTEKAIEQVLIDYDDSWSLEYSSSW